MDKSSSSWAKTSARNSVTLKISLIYFLFENITSLITAAADNFCARAQHYYTTQAAMAEGNSKLAIKCAMCEELVSEVQTPCEGQGRWCLHRNICKDCAERVVDDNEVVHVEEKPTCGEEDCVHKIRWW
jgi:hypothetical protein